MSKRKAEAAKKYSATEFKSQLTLLTSAGIRVFLVSTREQERLQSAIYDWCTANERPMRVWTQVRGIGLFANRFLMAKSDAFIDPCETTKFVEGTQGLIQALTGLYDTCSPTSPAPGAFGAVNPMLHGNDSNYPDKGVFVFNNAHSGFENPLVQQLIRQLLHSVLSGERIIIFVVPEGVTAPADIENELRMLTLPPPTHADLLDTYNMIAKNVSDADDEVVLPKFSDEDIDKIIENGAGMAQSEFEYALGIGYARHGTTISTDPTAITHEHFIEEVLTQKIEVIKKTELLELLDPVPIEDVGGLDLLKEWLEKRKIAFGPQARDLGLDMPRGMLTVGPPGTGKSHLAKACGSVLGYPVIKLDIGRVFSKYVGDSEARIRRALSLIEAMVPIVVLLDEIDKSFSQGNDGGTSTRVFGTVLQWLQERDKLTAPAFVVMTANNVVGMPPELMRRGRIDEVWSVNFPCAVERADILKIHLRKRGRELSRKDLMQVAKATPQFIGSELEAIVKEGLLEAATENVDISPQILIDRAAAIVPLAKAWEPQVRAMREWADKNARKSSSLTDDILYDDDVTRPAVGGSKGLRISTGPKRKLKGKDN